MSLKRVISTVTNDLVGDQRIHKAAMSLLKAGWSPELVGRRFKSSEPVSREYKTRRFRLLFNKGPLFYACYNIRLFCYLLVVRADLFLANDLDTLPAVWMASKLRKIPYVFDSHEYFTEVPELVNRRAVQKIWKSIERRILPGTKYMLTVNEEIAHLFEKEYDIKVRVLLNVPNVSRGEAVQEFQGQIPGSFEGKTLILYQGAINKGRGLENMIDAMPKLSAYALLVIGGGDILDILRKQVADLNLKETVHFTGRLPMEELLWYTQQADIGISLEQDLGLNYRLALPNKLFDYMHAGLPVLVSDLPVMSQLVNEVGFGMISNKFDPDYLAEKIGAMTADQERYKGWCDAALKWSAKYTWESQELVLTGICEEALNNRL
ncbi:MAG: glycosyltransferase [Bacteroidales bacterium]|nr:glycosyltransferase [Bacteroidales bacterium]